MRNEKSGGQLSRKARCRVLSSVKSGAAGLPFLIDPPPAANLPEREACCQTLPFGRTAGAGLAH
jgi:hypothetical protein